MLRRRGLLWSAEYVQRQGNFEIVRWYHLRDKSPHTISFAPSELAAGTVVGTVKLLHHPGEDNAETHDPG